MPTPPGLVVGLLGPDEATYCVVSVADAAPGTGLAALDVQVARANQTRQDYARLSAKRVVVDGAMAYRRVITFTDGIGRLQATQVAFVAGAFMESATCNTTPCARPG